MLRLLELIFVGVAVLLDTALAVPPPQPTDYNTVFSYNLRSSVTPCRSWIFPCLGGVYRCSSQNAYAASTIGPQPACPSLQNSTATPPPGVCSLANATTCSYVPDAPTCVSWLSNCDYQYSCTTEERFNTTVEEGEDCFPHTPRPPSPNTVCIPVDGSCDWYNPCRKWQGWCNGDYRCGTVADYAQFVNGPQPICAYPPPNITDPVQPGECVYQEGRCEWSECVSWRSPCQTSWECGSDYEHSVAESGPLPSCPAPPEYFMPPPEPGVCQISPESGTCEFIGEPECTGGQVFTTCGTLCPRTCDNYQLDFACTSQCVSGCFCPSDTVLHDGQCIPSSQCPGEYPCAVVLCAPGYECLVYEATGEAYCSPNCEELNPCADDELCVLTTVNCFRAPCPPVLSCQQSNCTGGREWQDCGTACPLSCSNYTSLVACTEQCVQGCFCPYGTYIHEDRCVPIADCPGYVNPCSYTDCAPGYECLVYEATGEAYCSPNCEELNPCADGELCVLTTVNCFRAPCPPVLSCQQKCSGGKEWRDCGSACPPTCDNHDTPVACTLQCVRGCFCPPDQVELNGDCINPTLCSVCDSCKEEEVCSVVNEGSGARYPICKGPVTVPCSDEEDLTCPEDSRCVTHNVTRESFCLQSCYLGNGGCSSEQVCYYERGDEDCNQLLEPCFKTTCTDIPDEVAEDACPIGWEDNECASACQSTCGDYLNPRIRACIAVCAKCQCPLGMYVFRDRCVDPLECHILLNESIPLNPLPQPGSVLLVRFTLVEDSRATVDSAGFATSAQNVLLRSGLNVRAEVYAILEEDGNTVVVLKLKASDRNQLSSVANLLMENRDALSSEVSSATVVDTPSQEEEEDDDDISTGVVAGSVVAAVLASSLVILTFVIIVVLILKRPKLMKRVQVPLDNRKEKPLDGVSYASLVSKGTENDYEIS